jgi:hypothetical protein
MATPSALNVAAPDFESIRDSLVNFLKAQKQFADYDFTGSNLSVLIDLLAYNGFQSAFFQNMALSEAFLDTAQTRDAVVSHSKTINYIPRSYKSSEAIVDITVVPTPDSFGSLPTQIILPKYTSFQSTMDSKVYNFSLNKALTITSTGTYTASSVSLFEGSIITENFIVTDNSTQRYIISNSNVDTDSLTVSIKESDQSSVVSEYSFASSLLEAKSTSKVYFIQGAENGRYELVFGDGTFGLKPILGNVIQIQYRISTGSVSNGASIFKPKGSLLGGYSQYYIKTINPASGGDIAESIDSIKFRAPRHYQTQERAVTNDDFKNILFEKYPEIRAIHVYGGETLNPPQYGKVIIVVDLKNVTGLPDVKKTEYTSYIKTKMLASITPLFIGPDYTYVQVVTDIKYNINTTTLAPSDIQSKVFSTVSNFNYNYLQNFDTTLRYSQLVASIDSSDVSIVGTNTILKLIKKINPILNTNQSFSISFQNQIKSGITSSSFTYNDVTCFIQDLNGSLNITTVVNDATVIVAANIGSIDYTTGNIVITNLNVSGYSGNGIKLYAESATQDFGVSGNTIVQINVEDVTVSVTAVRV